MIVTVRISFTLILTITQINARLSLLDVGSVCKGHVKTADKCFPATTIRRWGLGTTVMQVLKTAND
jgi:hypothetical protein